MGSLKTYGLALVMLVAGIGVGALSFGAGDGHAAKPRGIEFDSLLKSGQTAVGQPFQYPTGSKAQLTSLIVTLAPGAQTGWHDHDIPVFGYILEGEVTVDYGARGVHVYRAGDAVIEAIGVAHNGMNKSDRPVRILAVFLGVEGGALSRPVAGRP